ncbi:MAG TPA: sensor histidine kinase [Rhizomicrobium sp.]
MPASRRTIWLESKKGELPMGALMDFLEQQSKLRLVVVAILLALCIGVFDYLTGTHISLSAFYLLPVSLAAWFIGARFGLLIAGLCVAVWMLGGIGAGDEDFADAFLLTWNGTVQLMSFVVVVFVLARLRSLNQVLESRVRERASALTREIAERERLQHLLLDASEQEQRRIGQDLHDGLGQHLAGTAIAGQVLREKLERQRLREAADAKKVVELIEEGVSLTRRSVKGLHPVAMDAEGLMLALEEFAATSGRLFEVNCRFVCESPVLVHSAATAEHLFRIAQEATRNAIQHGCAKEIVIELNTFEEGHELRIEDDGSGIAPSLSSTGGMGLRIMAHRAQLIGASFEVNQRTGGGTIVTCRLPVAIEDQMAS